MLKKKIMVFTVTALMVLCMAACGANTDVDGQDSAGSSDTQDTEEVEREPADPLEPEAGSISKNGLNLTTKFLPLSEPITDATIGEHVDAAMYNDTLYILHGKKVSVYTFASDGFTHEKDVEFEAGESTITVNNQGQLITSSGVLESQILDLDTGEMTKIDVKGYLSASQTSDFGVSYFTNSDVLRYEGGVSAPWIFTNMNMTDGTSTGPFKSISVAEVVGDHALVVGSLQESGQRLVVYDSAGNQVTEMAETISDSLASAATETDSHYIVSVVGGMYFYDKFGVFITETDHYTECRELYGLDSDWTLWIKSMIPQADGSVIVIGTVSSTDYLTQVLCFRLSGLS